MRKKKNLPLLKDITIDKFAAEGKTVTRVKLREDDESPIVVFVPYAVPGDVCDIQIRRKKHSYAEGEIVRLITPSPLRVEPKCKHFGTCGGCKWQQMAYEAQTRGKQDQVEQVLQRIGKVELPPVSPIIAADNCWEYRNKMEYTFSNKRWKTWEELRAEAPLTEEGDSPSATAVSKPTDNALGFHIGGAFDKVLQIDRCHLQDDLGNRIRNFIYKYALDNSLSFYDIRNNHGLLRNIMIRITTTGENMLIVVFGEGGSAPEGEPSAQGGNGSELSPEAAGLLEAVAGEFPEITSLGYVVNLKLNDSIADQEVVIIKGKDHITEKMEDLKFRINPKSFYQTNSRQAHKLYSVARDFALRGRQDSPDDDGPIIYDLYTGAGTIANFVARRAKKVVGIEYVEEAIIDARENSKLNGIDNTTFYAGDMKDVLTADFIRDNGQPDVMIIDPPRAGMHGDVVNVILEAEPEVLVYVSCNPATQARDLELLGAKYRVTDVQPVDMFPHTHHVENVVRMVRIPSQDPLPGR